MTTDNGFITLHRKLLTWQWYTNVNAKTLFIHCLLRSNHKDTTWQLVDIKRGQFITSIKSLANETGLSERQVRTSLDKLILTNELTSKATNKYRIITVLKYNDYQAVDKQEVKQKANKRQSIDKQLTTDNNNNNGNNVKNVTKKEYGEFVKMLETDYLKLEKKISNLNYYLENLNNYIGSTGKKYKSHYHTILSWYNKDIKNNNNSNFKEDTETIIEGRWADSEIKFDENGEVINGK